MTCVRSNGKIYSTILAVPRQLVGLSDRVIQQVNLELGVILQALIGAKAQLQAQL